MATTTKSRNGSAARSSKRSTSTRRTNSNARKSTSGSARRSTASSRNRSTAQSRSQPQSNGSRLGTVAKAAGGALAGGAALAVAARAAAKTTRRPRVLGVPMPRSLKPALKPGKIDVKKVAKQLSNVAERVEKTSEDVRVASAQAKRVAKNLS
jgi:hypothetical protein